MASDPTTTLPAHRTQAVPDARTLRVEVTEPKQVALQTALSVLASGAALDRRDTPDEVVTAVRQLPAIEAAYAPFPDGIDPRLKVAFEKRGVHQLYTHQAEALDRKSVV